MADPTVAIGPHAPRREQLVTTLAAAEERVRAACSAAARARTEVTVVAVTKTYPVSDVHLLSLLGVRDVGESRDQEARVKSEAYAAIAETVPLRWHFVGQLQRNKVRSVARYAWMVHTVDRADVVDLLARHGGPPGGVLLQVSLELDGSPGAPGRGGAPPAAVPVLADRAATSGLRLAGVMGVAPRTTEPRRAFEVLARVSDELRRDHPQATVVSAGMSGDLEAAVSCGATHLRLGSSILGPRPQLR